MINKELVNPRIIEHCTQCGKDLPFSDCTLVSNEAVCKECIKNLGAKK